ncbi:MAG TPA: kelch repeat-containing protein, partial [Pyrinomonadaceae bacterium]|nr:kelch repeat-containing protein [Pyrinomonadaceae bacterium]
MNRTSHARQLTARSIYSFQRAFLTIPLAVVALAGLVLGGSGYLRTGTFSRLSKLTVARAGHTATLLPDGRVLIIGGDCDGTAEIYDPRAEIASPAGRMNSARTGHTASLLSDGRVLVAGGAVDGAALASTEIYDPSTEIFEPGPEMDSPRAGHTATTLSDGSILITGGGSDTELILNEGVFTQLRSKLAISRVNASALAMNDGRVLIVGGDDVASVEIFDPLTQMFEPVGEMRVMRARPLLRALRDGKVQIVGGNNDGSMEIYDPASNAIGAYAHVVPETDPCTNLATYVLSSATRAALIFRDSPSVDLDLNGHTITELGLAAIVIGGTDSRGEPVDTITRFDSSAATVTTDKLDYA